MEEDSRFLPICGKRLKHFRDGKTHSTLAAEIALLPKRADEPKDSDRTLCVGSISNYERGITSHCRRTRLADIATVLTCSIEDLGPRGNICKEHLAIPANKCRDCRGRATKKANRPVNLHAIPVDTSALVDPKNVIVSPDIARRLLKGKPPSMLECVRATVLRTLFDEEKPGNHFFGVSTLLYALHGNARTLLGYERRKRPGEPGSEKRTGFSILFHFSYLFRVDQYDGPMAQWVKLAESNPKAAESEFCRWPDGTLRSLLNVRKFDIPALKGTCRPRGVITRDLRETEEGTVFTQYVFETVLRVPDAKTIDDLKQHVNQFAPELHVSPWENVDPEFFLPSGHPPKNMDYVALLGKNSGRCEDTRFTSGFALV